MLHQSTKIQKPHQILLLSVIEALSLIFIDKKKTEKSIETIFKKNPKFGSKDRKFVAEITYDIVRNYRLLSHAANSEVDFWKILAAYFVISNQAIPKESEFNKINLETILTSYKNNHSFAIKHSYPDWLYQIAETELGTTQWETEAQALNKIAPATLRVNTLKTTKQILTKFLSDQNINALDTAKTANALMLNERQNLFQNELFKLGLFEFQDAGSQMISEFLDVKPGMRVIDACAGAGGKTLHLAALMHNKGRLISMDIHQWKLNELKKRAKRAGVSNFETKLIDSNKIIKKAAQTADRLLLDVPCSGLGVLKRKPDAKWHLSELFINEVKIIQQKIITDYSSMLKVGGYMVYATCSILPSENKKQVETFLASNNKYEFIKDQTLLPSSGTDGFYMALIKRIG